nr:MAG TPA: transposase [Caudoviricetes sp.]
MSRGKHFTEKEIEYLKVNSLVMSTKELADKLGRNYWAVHRKLQALGISKNHIFTPDEDYIIKRMYGKFTAKAIATKIGVDENAIYNRCKKLKLKNK